MNSQCILCNSLDDSSEFIDICSTLGIDVNDADTMPEEGRCPSFTPTPSPCATCDELDSVCATGRCYLEGLPE